MPAIVSNHSKAMEILMFKENMNKTWRFIKRDRYLLLMLLPVMAFYLVFHYAPMYGILIAFKDYNIFKGVAGSEWVGFENFINIFSTSDFYVVLRNTLMLNIFSLVINFPGPIILALLLNEIRVMSFKKVSQTIAYLPHFLSWVVVANMIIPMLSPSTGIINKIVNLAGIESIHFMANEAWWVTSYVLIGLWKSVGWGAIIYLSALAGIDPQLYEAAVIDGANRWKQTLHVTLPGISGTVVILLILNIGKLMNIGFEQPYLLGNSAVINVSNVISTYVYKIGLLSGDISRSTAIGIFQSLVNMILLILANRFSRRVSGNSIY